MSEKLSRSILVIDSGVGGLSICQSIINHAPHLQITYFADNAFFPYGLLDEDQLIDRLHKIVSAMLEEHEPELVVLACNTVSTLLLPGLRAKYDIPFVGVVPAIKPAAVHSKTKHIGLLATPATVQRTYLDDLITEFASDCEVTRVGSSELVQLAESFLTRGELGYDQLADIAQQFKTSESRPTMDTLVLGCTHFPLLKEQLQEHLPDVALVDSGDAIARRVVSLLGDVEGSAPKNGTKMSHELFFSRSIPQGVHFLEAIKRLGLDPVLLETKEI